MATTAQFARQRLSIVTNVLPFASCAPCCFAAPPLPAGPGRCGTARVGAAHLPDGEARRRRRPRRRPPSPRKWVVSAAPSTLRRAHPPASLLDPHMLYLMGPSLPPPHACCIHTHMHACIHARPPAGASLCARGHGPAIRRPPRGRPGVPGRHLRGLRGAAAQEAQRGRWVGGHRTGWKGPTDGGGGAGGERRPMPLCCKELSKRSVGGRTRWCMC